MEDTQKLGKIALDFTTERRGKELKEAIVLPVQRSIQKLERLIRNARASLASQREFEVAQEAIAREADPRRDAGPIEKRFPQIVSPIQHAKFKIEKAELLLIQEQRKAQAAQLEQLEKALELAKEKAIAEDMAVLGLKRYQEEYRALDIEAALKRILVLREEIAAASPAFGDQQQLIRELKEQQKVLENLDVADVPAALDRLAESQRTVADATKEANIALEEQAQKLVDAADKAKELQEAVARLTEKEEIEKNIRTFRQIMDQLPGPVPMPEPMRQRRLESQFGRPDFREVLPAVPRPEFMPKPEEDTLLGGDFKQFFGVEPGQVEKPEERNARLQFLESIDRRLEEQNQIEHFPLGLE